MRPTDILAVASAVFIAATGAALAQQRTFDINRISDSGVGEKIGTATVSEAKNGVPLPSIDRTTNHRLNRALS